MPGEVLAPGRPGAVGKPRLLVEEREKVCIRADRYGVAACEWLLEEKSSVNDPLADGLVL